MRVGDIGFCKNCGDDYRIKSSNHEHCSKECRVAYKYKLRVARKPEYRKCQIRGCNNRFKRTQGRRYCDSHQFYARPARAKKPESTTPKFDLAEMSPEARLRAYRTIHCLETGEAFT